MLPMKHYLPKVYMVGEGEGEGGEVVSKEVLICRNILESQENRKLQ